MKAGKRAYSVKAVPEKHPSVKTCLGNIELTHEKHASKSTGTECSKFDVNRLCVGLLSF